MMFGLGMGHTRHTGVNSTQVPDMREHLLPKEPENGTVVDPAETEKRDR